MYYKNKNSGGINLFGGNPGKDWVLASKTEIINCNIAEVRLTKIEELVISRDDYNNQPVLTKVGDVEFLIKKKDTETLGKRIRKLAQTDDSGRAEWSSVKKERLNLDLHQFKELLRMSDNHFDERDETAFKLYFEMEKKIKDCTTLGEVKQINVTNFYN